MANSRDQWRFQFLCDDAMRIISPILDGAALAAAAPGDLLTSALKAIDPGIGWFDDSADGRLCMVPPALPTPSIMQLAI